MSAAIDTRPEQFLWTEKYRPKTVAECILTPELKSTFQNFVKEGNIPNLLLSGPPGVGKTTIARAMLDELGADYYFVNASLANKVDNIRFDVQDYASSVSLTGGRKYVILDEADRLTPAAQDGLRGFIEAFAGNCGFILTCNHRDRITDALISRTSTINFVPPAGEAKAKLAMEFFTRVKQVLDSEKVTYEPKALAELINKYFPDWRRVLNELQRFAAQSGSITAGVLSQFTDERLTTLVSKMKEKDYTAVRKWVALNTDIDSATFYRKLYDTCATFLHPSSIPQMVIIISQYSDRATRVADQEVNTAAFAAEIMVSCTFT